jgi:hypothetical protein
MIRQLSAVCLLAWTAVGPRIALAIENNLPAISAMPSVVQEGQSFSLMFSGTAPDSCGISVVSTQLDGDQIVIKTRRSDSVCLQVLTPFRQPITVFSGNQSARAGVYKVRVEFEERTAGSSSTRVLATTLVPVLKSGTRAVVPETGGWNFEPGGSFATSGSGVNFNIERQGENVVVLPNFYDGKGEPRWYFAAGQQVGNSLIADLYDISGGQALFSAYKPPSTVQPIGTLHLEFLTPSRATVWLQQPIDSGLLDGLKIMPISISRFNYGFGERGSQLGGKWVFASEVSGGVDSQVLDFAPIANAQTGQTASYQAGEFRLNCTGNAATPNSLPNSCALLRGSLQVGVLDRVGYQRLRGQDSSGRGISLFRIEP